jgi:cell division transport system permease protein
MSQNKTVKRPKLAKEGFCGQLRYFFARAITNIRQNILVNILTIGTISLAILIVSLLLLVYVNLTRVTEQWSERIQVTVYFNNELPPQELKVLNAKIQSLEGTDKVVYVTKAEALQRFRARLKGQDALLEGVSAEILPASLEIQLNKEYRSSDALKAYVAQLNKIQGISEIQYGDDWVKRFNNFMDFMRLVGISIGCFLVLAVVFIVANTIKLTIYSRKDELELLGLVGATRLFIKTPFLIEGILQGAAGATLALVVLSCLYFGFLHNAGSFLSFNPLEADIVFLPLSYLSGIFFSGIMLGFLGSLTSLKRFINP